MTFSWDVIALGAGVTILLTWIGVGICKLYEYGKNHFPGRPAWFQILAPMAIFCGVLAAFFGLVLLVGNGALFLIHMGKHQ